MLESVNSIHVFFYQNLTSESTKFAIISDRNSFQYCQSSKDPNYPEYKQISRICQGFLNILIN